MAEYHKMMHMEEIEPDALDEYLSINEENSINQLDIIHLFGKEKLETIQESLSKATGLAFIPLHRQPPFHAIVRRFAITRRQWRDVNLRMPSVPSRQQLHKRQTYTFVPADFWRWPFQLLSAAIIWEVLLGGRFNAMMPRNLSAGCHRLCILPRRMRRLRNTGRCWRKFLFIHMKNFWI